MSDDLLGKTLGHFRVDAKLGEGAMGVVYRATDERLRREVALKVLHRSLASDPERRARFLREARLAAAVTHANVAAIHEAGEADGWFYLAMELVSGSSLHDVMLRGPLPVRDALAVARGILRGIAKAHDKGVVHRDLKPENVMLDEDGEVKVLDFGIAKAGPGVMGASAIPLTHKGALIGTPAYMSPEQGTGKEVDARTDLFAFGIILFEMLTGRRPFGGVTPLEMIVCATTEPPDTPSRHAPEVSPELDRFVHRCLEKQPDARFANAREALAALDAIAGAVGSSPRLTAPTPAPSEPSGPGTVVIGPIGILDVAPPASPSPAAVEAYLRGLKGLRGCDWTTAADELGAAVKLDPSLAPALLRLALVSGFNASYLLPTEIRAYFNRAAQLRDRMSPRDRDLLRALEPFLLAEPRDLPECRRRFEAVLAKHGWDGELHMIAASAMDGFDPGAQRVWGARAVQLDPQDASAWQAYGGALSDTGDPDGARAAFERITDISPTGVDGFYELAMLAAREGQATAAERHARRIRAVLGPTANECDILASALYAQGRSLDDVREILRGKLPVVPESRRSSTEAHDKVCVAAISGDFDAALAHLTAWRAILGAEQHLEIHGAWARLSVLVARERGDDAGAVAVAERFLAGRDAWARTHRRADDATPLCLAVALSAGRVSAAHAAKVRDTWIAEAIGSPGCRWGIAFAPALERGVPWGDAARAMLPPPDRFWFGRFPMLRYDAGVALLTVGERARAIELLGGVAKSCLAILDPFRAVHASLHLGAALEASGDRAGARAAYRSVVERWGSARPVSASAAKAAARLLALG
jgi:serine/threonine-protein kinase